MPLGIARAVITRSGATGAVPGEVTILDSAALNEGGSYTASAGSSNRLLLYVAGGRNDSSGSALGFDGINFGSVAMTQAHVRFGDAGSAGLGRIATGYFVKAADIPSGAQTLTVDWTVTPAAPMRGVIYTLEGVDQTTPIGDVADEISTSDATVLTVTATTAIAFVEGDMCFAATSWRNDHTGNDLNARTGFTRDLNVFSDATTRVVARRAITAAGSETFDFNRGGSGGNNQCACVWFNVQAVE